MDVSELYLCLDRVMAAAPCQQCDVKVLATDSVSTARLCLLPDLVACRTFYVGSFKNASLLYTSCECAKHSLSLSLWV